MDKIGENKIRVPETPVKAGDSFQVKTLIHHPMESGRRKDAAGKPVPAYHLRQMRVEYLGEEVMNAQLTGGVSRSPYCAFWIKASQTGVVKVTWEDTKGDLYTAEATVQVV